MTACRRQNPLRRSKMCELPVELLSEIFDLCVLATIEPGVNSNDPSAPLNINTETIRVPLTLSSVNRRWRQIALSQASLWANICITEELISQRHLDGRHITTCLARSRHHPLTILIDSRDPDWDFTEADVGIDVETTLCSVLFTPTHMSKVIALLLPQLPRWRALTILTDTWAPMHAALTSMNLYIIRLGAPQLESLILMRCNDFVSFADRFQPENLKDPGFLSGGREEAANMLPSLKHLALAGVHVDWDALAASSADLTYLQLSSHAANVRPAVEQFHRLLQANPNLRELCLSGSGPQDRETDVLHRVVPSCEQVHLPSLKEITLGYRKEHEGETLFRMLDAPNLQTLTLEDATYPADPVDVNAGSMLVYLATRESPDSTSVYKAGYSPPAEVQPQLVCSRCSLDNAEQRTTRAAFPLLQRLTMKNLKALHYPFRTFFNAHAHLQHVELDGMTVLPVYALIPGVGRSVSSNELTCPCPRLRSLCLKSTEHMAVHDLDFVFHQLGDLREARGALPLAKAEIHVDGELHAKSLRMSAEYASARTKFVVVDGSAGGEEVDMEVVTTEEKRETTVSYGYHGRTNESGLPRTPVPYMVPQQPITAH